MNYARVLGCCEIFVYCVKVYYCVWFNKELSSL